MTTHTRPSRVPAEAAAHPPEPTPEELALSQGGAVSTATASDLDRPQFQPPGTAAAAATVAAAGWLSNRHVLMKWQTPAPESWLYLDGGTGWRALNHSAEPVTRSLNLLVDGARVSGSIVQVYEGTGGTVDAFYLW